MRHFSIFHNRCKITFTLEKSKSNLSTNASNYVLIIQKLGKVFLREILFSVTEPEKKTSPKTSNIWGTRWLGEREGREGPKTRELFKDRENKYQTCCKYTSISLRIIVEEWAWLSAREWCFNTEILTSVPFTYIHDGINLRHGFIISWELVYLDIVAN